MIRLSRTVASSRSLLLYEDSEDPALFYYMPKSAELDGLANGGVRFAQRMFRPGSSSGAAVSAYFWTVRSVVPDSELAELRDEMAARSKHPVRLEAVQFWPTMTAIGVTILTDAPWDLLMCKAWTPDAGPGEITVMLAAADSAEPSLAERFMDSSGLEVSLECKVTGASTPFRGTLQGNFGAVQQHLLTAFPEPGLVSWSQVAGEVETLLSDGTLRLRIEDGAADSSVTASAVTRYVVNRLTRLHRLTPLSILPGMHGARFRLKEGGEPDRWETVELTEFELETRALPVSARIRSVPVDAFHGLDGTHEELPQKLARHLMIEGIRFKDGALVRQRAVSAPSE